MKIILMDLDDTLIKTQEFYDKVTEDTVEIINKEIPVEFELIKKHFNDLDFKNMKEGKYNIKIRYIKSFIETYVQLCDEYNIEYKEDIEEEVRKSSSRIFDEIIPIEDGAEEFLKEIQKNNISLQVLTLGDELVQSKRLSDVKIEHYFEEVHVTSGSKLELMKNAVEKVGKENVIMIGNSLRSDIHPALEVGIKAIHIVKQTWEYDKYEIDSNDLNYFKVKDYKEILKLI